MSSHTEELQSCLGQCRGQDIDEFLYTACAFACVEHVQHLKGYSDSTRPEDHRTAEPFHLDWAHETIDDLEALLRCVRDNKRYEERCQSLSRCRDTDYGARDKFQKLEKEIVLQRTDILRSLEILTMTFSAREQQRKLQILTRIASAILPLLLGIVAMLVFMSIR